MTTVVIQRPGSKRADNGEQHKIEVQVEKIIEASFNNKHYFPRNHIQSALLNLLLQQLPTSIFPTQNGDSGTKKIEKRKKTFCLTAQTNQISTCLLITFV